MQITWFPPEGLLSMTVSHDHTHSHPHDVGGEPSGEIDTRDQGMTHWEKHANAFRMVMTGKGLASLDEMRRAAEDLGTRFYKIGYFERQTEAAAIALIERGVFTQSEFDGEMEAARARFDVPALNLPSDHDHDGKPIQEDDAGGPPNEHHIMNLAMQALLVARGHLTAAEVRQMIENFDQEYPSRGAEVVVKGWMDPSFKASLLNDAKAAIASMGIDLEFQDDIVAVENTDDVHNIVVCTLCSCYPRFLLGQPPTWYKSRAYRSRTVHEPRAVLREFGTEIPSSVRIQVHDSNADLRYLVVPKRPEGTDNWNEKRLKSILTRDCFVGVAVPEAVSR